MANIGIIGSGISGLASAFLLARAHDVTLIEADTRLGGHARTLTVRDQVEAQTVDTGFIVYNEVNYPHLTRLFAHLGVVTEPSDMSFAVTWRDGAFEFCGSSLAGLFAQPGNVVSPAYWRMLADTLRFFRNAGHVLHRDDDPELGTYLDELRLGRWVQDRFLLPMGAAIWSTPPGEMRRMPAKTFVRFFENHGLLSVRGHHAWRTVSGGSARYVEKIAEAIGHDRIFTGQAAAVVQQRDDGIAVLSADGSERMFDHVVLACHADKALGLLDQPTDVERMILGAFRFRDNVAYLHRDASHMPIRRRAWASWVYAAGGENANASMSVTYWMNRLQNLPGDPLFVTLNPTKPVADHLLIDQHTFRHPVFDTAAIEAQSGLGDIQGRRNIWFAGAWQRYGFHEDGLASAVDVARRLGVSAPWA